MPLPQQSADQLYRFGPFEVDAAAREVRRGAQVLKAPPKVFDLLLALLENRHKVVPRQEILKLVWPRAVVSRGALPQSMLKLRKLLGGEQASEQWIATVRGVGYRFVGTVQVQRRALAGVSSADSAKTGPGRRTLNGDEVVHRVDVLNQLGMEHSLRMDHDGLRKTIAALQDRQVCGSDPRARILALLHQTVIDRHAGQLEKTWQTLLGAQQLADQLANPFCEMCVLRAKGLFFLQFVGYGDAIPWFRRAYDAAERLGASFELANCAFLLAVCMGRAGDASGSEEWMDRTGELARLTRPRWVWTYLKAAMSGTQIYLGERAKDDEDMPRARRHWMLALQMLDDAESAGYVGELGKFATVLPINRAWALGHLEAGQRMASIETFRSMLACEPLPQMQLTHLLGLTTFSVDEGCLEDARGYCDQGLALGDSTRIFRHHAGFLSFAADISTRHGRHADAVRQLRALLKWQEDVARADAVRIAKVTAMRLKTERALAAAEVERGVALQLQAENEALKREARLRGTEDRFNQATGQLPMSMFRSWLVLTLARMKLRQQSLVLAVVCLPATATNSQGNPASEPSNWAGLLGECLSAHLRVSDRWTLMDAWQLVVALGDVDLDRAQLVAARLRRDIVSALNLGDSDRQAISIVAFDVAQLPDVEAVMDRIKLSAPSTGAAPDA